MIGSILVIIVARIGDTLLVTPTLRALAEQWPEARLTVAAHRNRVSLLENIPYIDQLSTIDKRRAPFLGWLPGKPYDLVLVYGHDTALLDYARRVGQRVIAFTQADATRNARLQPAVAPPETLIPAVEERALLLSPLDTGLHRRQLDYVVSETERSAARDWARTHLPEGDGPIYGLQPSSFPTKAYRDWPAQSFVDIAARLLAREPEARLVVLGGPDGRERAETVAADIGPRAVCSAGKFSLRDNAALMTLLDLYVGVDTGPTHIAGALGIPMVGLYHCQHPGRYLQPLDHPNGIFIEHPAAPENCSRTHSMAEISVDQVWQAIETVLNRT